MRRLRLLLCLFALAVLGGAPGCGRGGGASPEAAVVAEDAVVVEGYGVAVRQRAFAEEYRRFASLAPGRDGLDARRAYARLMLERAYVAARGDSAGLGARPEVRTHVARQRALAMRRAWLLDTVGAGLAAPTAAAIAEADVREAFRRQQTRLRLQQVYAPTRAAADSLYALLQAGASFDALAAEALRAQGVEPEPGRAGHLGWVTWNDLDLAPEAAAYALDRNAVSAPVASLNGWHLFRLLDREETVRLDATAYQSARERLRHEVWQRRFDEAAARFLRPLLTGHELAVHLAPLRALWPDLAPLVPADGDLVQAGALREQVPGLAPQGVPRATPVATVDGRPFTVGQLLDALPDIPLGYWTPDLRKAVEVAVRDSILTARAAAAGYADHPDARHAAAVAERTALYYAALAAAADTVDFAAHARAFYARWKDAQFVDRVTTRYRTTRFADSTAAWQALRQHQAGARWDTLAADVPSDTLAHTAAPGERGPFGVHALPLPDASAPAGPFRDGEAWAVVEVVDRERAYVPYAEARADVLALMENEPRGAVHQILLGPLSADAPSLDPTRPSFDPHAVTFHDDALRASLPDYTLRAAVRQ